MLRLSFLVCIIQIEGDASRQQIVQKKKQDVQNDDISIG